MKTVNYKDWEFKINMELTEQTYAQVLQSGTETCSCNDCKNYIANRDRVFPEDVLKLLKELGIDYRKEVDIIPYQTLDNGLHLIGGSFHFKGRVIKGKNYRIPMPLGGYSVELTTVNEAFSIGFAEGNDLTFFSDKSALVQVEFIARIPWVIDKSLEHID